MWGYGCVNQLDCSNHFILYVCIYKIMTLYTSLYFLIFFFIFWPHRTACGISVLQPRIEPGPRQWKRWILTTRPPGNSLYTLNIYSIICQLYLNKLEKRKKKRDLNNTSRTIKDSLGKQPMVQVSNGHDNTFNSWHMEAEGNVRW